MKYLIVFCFLLGFWSCETKTTSEDKSFEFDLRWLALKDKTDCKMEKSAQFGKKVLSFQPLEKDNHLIISGIGAKVNWGQAKYFICEVYNPGEFSEQVCFDFYGKKSEDSDAGKETPVISPKIEVRPSVITKIVLPLSCLTGEIVSIETIPGGPISFHPGKVLDPKSVGVVHLSLGAPTSTISKPTIEISAMYLSNVKPENKLKQDRK